MVKASKLLKSASAEHSTQTQHDQARAIDALLLELFEHKFLIPLTSRLARDGCVRHDRCLAALGIVSIPGCTVAINLSSLHLLP
jgi:hypothetical protein